MIEPPDSASSRDRKADVIAHLNELTTPGLYDWLRNRLHGVDQFGGNADESPRELVALIYHSLDKRVRQDMQYAFYEALDAIVVHDADWSSLAAVELLLLADPLLLDTIEVSIDRRRTEALDALIRLARSDAMEIDRAGIRIAATQALVTIEAKVAPRFWYSLYDTYGPSYAVFVIEALARSDIDALTVWLHERLPDAIIDEAIINLLPFILETQGSRITALFMTAISEKLSLEAREELEFFAVESGISLSEPLINHEIAFALSHALDFVTHTIRSIPAVVHTRQLREGLLITLDNTRTGIRTGSSMPYGTKLQLWSKYVNCIDAAITDADMTEPLFAELAYSVDMSVLKEFAQYLVADRGVPLHSIPVAYLSPTARYADLAAPHAAGTSATLPHSLSNSLIAALESAEFGELKQQLVALDHPKELLEELVASVS